MSFYAYIKNEKIIGSGQAKLLNNDVTNIEINEKIYNNIDKYIYKNNSLIIDIDYDKKQHIKQLKIKLSLKESQTGLTRAIREIYKNSKIEVSDYVFNQISELEKLADELRS